MPIEFENPSRYQELLETLAGQVHRDLIRQYPEELWRVRHKGLPYSTLTEEQKALVRAAAQENLQALLGSGVHIELPRTPESELWQVRIQVENLLKQGEPILAYDLVQKGLKDHPGDLSLRQLQALAFIRTGAPGEAMAVLRNLLQEGHRDQGTLAPLARAYRDQGERALLPERRQLCFTRAFELYDEAYRANRGVWSGIHAAWLALELGSVETASELAGMVESGAREMLERARAEGADPFWYLAILGIAALLQRRFREGFDRCEDLADLGRGRSGDAAEVRHITQRILVLLREDPTSLELVLPTPKVVVFAGHMVDFPDRTEPRFPLSLVETVARMIRDRTSSHTVEAGFASAACGAPILFHESMVAQGGESHVLLPYGREEFLADSVAIREDMDWRSRFATVLEKAKSVIVASPQRLDEGSEVFSYANQLLLGLALIRARQLRCGLQVLAVWDGQPSTAAGSVAQTLATWKRLGYEADVINLHVLRTGYLEKRKKPRRKRDVGKLPAGLVTRTMIMLFADVVHFTQLQERQIPHFVAHFLGAVGQLEKDLDLKPAMKNTWGDGLFLVFNKAQDAIRYGTALVDRMGTTDWASLGLPADLNLRVALHAGPVYVGRDPVTGHRTCYGAHVNNAARIEPITPPGRIYVSQAFAALATAHDLKDCACEYVGRMPLAKNYGEFPMYVLQTSESPLDDGD